MRQGNIAERLCGICHDGEDAEEATKHIHVDIYIYSLYVDRAVPVQVSLYLQGICHAKTYVPNPRHQNPSTRTLHVRILEAAG